MAERIEGLLAAGDLKAPKILILGSMPSAQSLQKGSAAPAGILPSKAPAA